MGSGQSIPVLVRGLTQSTMNPVSASVRRSHTSCGALPARELLSTIIVFRYLKLPSSDGKVPVKEFWSNRSETKAFICPNSVGMGPESTLSDIPKDAVKDEGKVVA